MDDNERKATMEEMRAEALKRLGYFITNYSLNPKTKTDFENGVVYYSYTASQGLEGLIEDITHNTCYADVVAEFEKNHGGIVYHVIEDGSMLMLMYVSEYPDRWKSEIRMGNLVDVFIYFFDYPNFSSFSCYRICEFEENGALIIGGHGY